MAQESVTPNGEDVTCEIAGGVIVNICCCDGVHSGAVGVVWVALCNIVGLEDYGRPKGGGVVRGVILQLICQVLAEQQHLGGCDGLVAKEHIECVDPAHLF